VNRPIYLDYNGTTPHHPEVIAAMRPFLEEEFGNPSSGHLYAVRPRQAVARARRQLADLLGCTPAEVVFTSGGTEANNWAILGSALGLAERGRHIVTSCVEHPAVLNVCRFLEERHGFAVTRVAVDGHGRVDPAAVAAALRPDTVLVSIMHANNEVGTIQPIAAIARLARERGVRVHTDAAQSVGKIPVLVEDLGVDLLSVAGHKLYAPKGVGALYVRRGTALGPLLHGAGQEGGLRAGTENVLEIVGLGQACEIARRDLAETGARLRVLRDRLEAALAAAVPEMRVNGHPEKRLPNTLNVSFRGLAANRLLEAIGLEVAASAGAACHADRTEISHVLAAMGVPEAWAAGTLRLTVGRMTTAAEVDAAAAVIAREVAALRDGASRRPEGAPGRPAS